MLLFLFVPSQFLLLLNFLCYVLLLTFLSLLTKSGYISIMPARVVPLSYNKQMEKLKEHNQDDFEGYEAFLEKKTSLDIFILAI